MFNIILVVIGLALVAAVTTVTLNYVPVEALLTAKMQREAEQGLESLEGAVVRYLDLNRGPDGNVQYPGDGVNMVNAVHPAYGFIPAPVQKEMVWDLQTGTYAGQPAVGICLAPSAISTPMQRGTMARMQARSPIGSTIISTSCFSASNTSGGGYLTRWIPLSHVN